jgi:hypothetical protein
MSIERIAAALNMAQAATQPAASAAATASARRTAAADWDLAAAAADLSVSERLQPVSELRRHSWQQQQQLLPLPSTATQRGLQLTSFTSDVPGVVGMVAALPPHSLTMLDVGLYSSCDSFDDRMAFDGTALSAALARLTSLQQLRVTFLRFDCWPALGQLTLLTRLEMSGGYFDNADDNAGSGAALLQLLEALLPLRQLRLRCVQKLRLPRDMRHLTRLEDLDLDTAAGLEDTLLPRQLQRLSLPCWSVCALDGPALAAVMPLQQLTSLSFEVGCGEQQPLLRLAQLPALQHLCLKYDLYTPEGLARCAATSPAWAQLPQLQRLDAWGTADINPTTQQAAAILAGIAATKTLTSLSLELMNPSDWHDLDACECLVGLTRLKHLELSCETTSRGYHMRGDRRALTALTGLTWLSLNGCINNCLS